MALFRLIKDSRGLPSWSHTLAIPAIIGITGWFLTGGIDVTFTISGNSYHILTATKTAGEYSIAVGVWLAFFAQREYVTKVSETKALAGVKKNGTGPAPGAAV